MFDASDKKIVPNLGDHKFVGYFYSPIAVRKAKIKNFNTVNSSSPSFLKIMKILGAKFEIKK